MPQAVLGIAFSFGIPMAFSAVQGGEFTWASMLHSVPGLAWALLLGNLCWVLAYDTEYAMVDRDDDLRIGMKTSAITLAQYDVQAVAAFYALYLLSWWGLLRDQQLGWPWKLGLTAAALQALWHLSLIRGRQREACFQAFRVNHWLGATVFAGIAAGYMRLYYQPKIHLDTLKVVGVEALLRWYDPERGVIPPLSVIPVAEEHGMITEITFAVFRLAAEQQAAWQKAGIDLVVAVNISADDLLRYDLPDRLREIGIARAVRARAHPGQLGTRGKALRVNVGIDDHRSSF